MIQENEHRAIARILVTEGSRTRARGTGFLIAPSFVLTAHHVVCGAETDGTKVAIHLDFAGQDGKGIPVNIVGDAWDERLDWALLRLTKPVTIPPLPIATRLPGFSRVEFETRGFPDLNAVDGKTFGGPVRNASGTYKDDAPAIELYSEETKGVPVAGLSGGPLLVGGQVVGLIRSALLEEKTVGQKVVSVGMGTLYATALSEVFADGRVQTAVEENNERLWLPDAPPVVALRPVREVWQAVAHRLSNDLLKRLGGEWSAIHDKSTAARLLCEADSLPTVARILDRTHARGVAERAPEELLDRLEEIAAWVLPMVFWNESLRDSRMESEVVRGPLGFSMLQLVELALAGQERKPFQFDSELLWGVDPRPANQLSLPSDAAINDEVTQRAAMMGEGRATGDAFGSLLDFLAAQHGFSASAWRDCGNDRGEELAFLRGEWEAAAGSFDERRPFLIIKPSHRLHQCNAIEEIERHLEMVHLVEVDERPKVSERNLFITIRKLLHRANKRRNQR